MLPKKSFSLAGAKPKLKSKDVPTNVGRHLCAVQGLRQHSGFHGLGIFLDFVVLAYAAMATGDKGVAVPAEHQKPTRIGHTDSHKIYPDNAKASGRMSAELAYQREQGKIQVMVAACLGLSERQAEQVDDDVFNAAVSVQRNERGEPVFEGRPLTSPCIGNLIVVDRVYYPSGKSKGYYEIKPYIAELYPEFRAAAEAHRSGKAAPAAVEVPKTLPFAKKAESLSFEQAAGAAGWEVHPSDPSFVYNESTEEVVEIDELRSRLGYSLQQAA